MSKTAHNTLLGQIIIEFPNELFYLINILTYYFLTVGNFWMPLLNNEEISVTVGNCSDLFSISVSDSSITEMFTFLCTFCKFCTDVCLQGEEHYLYPKLYRWKWSNWCLHYSCRFCNILTESSV